MTSRTAHAEAAGDPPGRMIAVGDTHLHIQCQGEGSPTVVMEAGLGTAGLEWTPLRNMLARYTTACSYDRAGLGWSEASDRPRTASRMADELHELLRGASAAAPYVLVAHSFGGLVAQVFAFDHPWEVAGLILVDSSHPEQVERFRAQPIGLNTVPRPGYRVMMMSVPEPPAALPDELRPAIEALNHQEKSIFAASMELTNFRRSAHEAGDKARPLDLPVIVISRGRKVWSRGPKAGLKEALWQNLQSELGALSARSAHLVAENSRHHVHLDQPQLVADAVRLVLRDVHGGGCASKDCAIEFADASWVSNSLMSSRLAMAGPAGWWRPRPPSLELE